MPTAASETEVLRPLAAGMPRWQLQLLGRIEARRGDLLISRLPTSATAALLARLALQPQRMHPREELAELLWPGTAGDVGRNRLRQALSTLKRLLEPDGEPVIVADRLGLRLREGTMDCDALVFERCARTGRTEEARALYRGELMPGWYDDWVLTERGRLANLYEQLPEPARPTAIESPQAPRTALPVYLSSLYGRSAELAALASALGSHRLVTLTGAGGCGKTRLAVEVARVSTGHDCVFFVPLADCNTLSQAAAQLCTALRIPISALGAVAQVAQALQHSRALLVLDNFEQLVACGGPELIDQLLQRAPELHLLVSSRRGLGLPGERELPLTPLPLPPTGAALPELLNNASVALFMDRARAVQPAFAVDADNQATLGAICRALEGVPLALELAAARTRAYSLRELHEALTRPLAVLERKGAGVGRVPRHDSLHAAIAWSWRLLDLPLQRFLAALSVFRGGCTADDAEAVCDAPQARESLEALAADSLLRTETDAQGALRFHLFELVREFAASHLDSAERGRLRQRHRAHLLSLALSLQAQGAAHIGDQHLPNVQQALRSAVEDSEPELALMLGLALSVHWQGQGIAPESLALLRDAAARARGAASLLVPAGVMLAQLSLSAADLPGARQLAEQALVDAGGHGPLRAQALCGWVRVVLDGERSGVGLEPLLDEALALAAGDAELQARALVLQASLALRHLQQPDRALRLLEHAQQLFAAAGARREARWLGHERAVCLLRLRRYDEALAAARRHEQDCLSHGEPTRGAAAINLQGVLLSEQRRWAEALQAYGRCLATALSHRVDYWVAFALWNHCRNLARLRRPIAAARLMAYSAQYWTQHYTPLDAHEQHFQRRVRRLVQAQIGHERCEAEWAAGAAMSGAEAIALARAALEAGY